MRKFDVAPEDVIYIGDQPTDGEAAATAGIAFGAVAWGYGAYDAFHSLQSHEWFADVSELRRLAGSDTHLESSASL
jgi:phosphoglycolate phosphatase